MNDNRIPISSKPEQLREFVLNVGKAMVEVDNLDHDYTHTCSVGDIIMVEPSRPPISATRRYIVWYQNKLIYCKIMRTRNDAKWNILGIGEVNVCDVKFWCNTKKKNSLC
jgi:hypothetical protein